MARSKKSSPATEAVVLAPEAVVLAPEAVVLAPAAPEAVVLAPAAPVLPVDVKVAGETVTAARNVLARAANLDKVPTALGSMTLREGRPCKVRVPYTVAGVTAMLNHIAIHGPSTGAELAGIANGDLLTYAVRRGWLVPA
jgi:hypothetical protein